jgi:hypothetical protein
MAHAELYSRDTDQKKLARDGMAKLQLAFINKS